MRRVTFLLAVLLVAAALAGCAEPAPTPPKDSTTPDNLPSNCTPGQVGNPGNATGDQAAKPRVLLATSAGNITVELFVEQAPLTAQNFLDLVGDCFYVGTKFHRVIDGFMIQGGDPNTKTADVNTWGRGGPTTRIQDEFHPSLRHEGEGLLSMANSGADTGGSQFFITLGSTPHLDDRHAIFGRVVEGMDVVKAIGKSPVVNAQTNRPVSPVTINNTHILPDPAPAAATHGVGVH
ncbi:MAG TPA: peptidylprolyl isomerase, partial [Candidatus Thermoplasmatota archaeon]|nr:peptidylprolyl isomerase [Candidatus Thermoplasmatota archaeon]